MIGTESEQLSIGKTRWILLQQLLNPTVWMVNRSTALWAETVHVLNHISGLIVLNHSLHTVVTLEVSAWVTVHQSEESRIVAD